MKLYKIKEFSNLVGSEVSTIRYYDSLGLFKEVIRDENNHRLFPSSNIQCYEFIDNLKQIGMTLDRITTIKIEISKDEPDYIFINKLINGYYEILNNEQKQLKLRYNLLETLKKDIKNIK